MRRALAGTPLLVALVVAGCGGGTSPSKGGSGNGEASKSARQVLSDAVKAADAASSFHVVGRITSSGQHIGVDLTVAKGKGATGSFTLEGQKVNLVVVGKDGYMKAGAAFWSQFGGPEGSTIAPMLENMWIKFPTNNRAFGQMTSVTDVSSLFDKLGSTHGTLTNNGASTFDGRSVVAIAGGPKNGTLYVADAGTPYPVGLRKTGTAGGTITFDNWNKSLTLTAPAGALDFSSFGGR